MGTDSRPQHQCQSIAKCLDRAAVQFHDAGMHVMQLPSPLDDVASVAPSNSVSNSQVFPCLYGDCMTWYAAFTGPGSLGHPASGAPCSHPADASARPGLQSGPCTCAHVPPPQGTVQRIFPQDVVCRYVLCSLDNLLCSKVWGQNHGLAYPCDTANQSRNLLCYSFC